MPPMCRCGSGKFPYWERDGYGIPLVKCCDDCRAEKLKGFRPDVKERYDCDEPIEED